MRKLVQQLALALGVLLLLSACGARLSTVSYRPTTPSYPTQAPRVVAQEPASPPAPARDPNLRPLKPQDVRAAAGLTFTLIDVVPSLFRGGPEIESPPPDGHTSFEAGLKARDVILRVGGVETKTACSVIRAIQDRSPLTYIEMEILRGSTLMRGNVLLARSQRVWGCS